MKGHNPGENDDEWDKKFEKRGKENSELALSQCPGGQGSLRDELVEAPIVKIRDPNTNDQGSPGEHRVIAGKNHMELVGIDFKKVLHSTDRLKTEEKGHGGPDYQGGALKKICPRDRL